MNGICALVLLAATTTTTTTRYEYLQMQAIFFWPFKTFQFHVHVIKAIIQRNQFSRIYIYTITKLKKNWQKRLFWKDCCQLFSFYYLTGRTRKVTAAVYCLIRKANILKSFFNTGFWAKERSFFFYLGQKRPERELLPQTIKKITTSI